MVPSVADRRGRCRRLEEDLLLLLEGRGEGGRVLRGDGGRRRIRRGGGVMNLRRRRRQLLYHLQMGLLVIGYGGCRRCRRRRNNLLRRRGRGNGVLRGCRGWFGRRLQLICRRRDPPLLGCHGRRRLEAVDHANAAAAGHNSRRRRRCRCRPPVVEDALRPLTRTPPTKPSARARCSSKGQTAAMID